VKKLACMLGVLGAAVCLSATGAVAWDVFDNMVGSLQTPWQGQGQLPWQGQSSSQGQPPLQGYAKGNETGGIIPWSPDNELVAREVANAYCQGYGKYPRITGVHRQYGDYISFNCLWTPDAARYGLPEVRLRSQR
jgi:hypothetical protein